MFGIGLGIWLHRFWSRVPVDLTPVSPAALFQAGDGGAFYDFTDFANTKLNTNGTGDVVLGDIPAYYTDLSGNGKHVTQTDAAARMTITADGLVSDRQNDNFNIPLNNFTGDFILVMTTGFIAGSFMSGADGWNYTVTPGYEMPGSIIAFVMRDRAFTEAELNQVEAHYADRINVQPTSLVNAFRGRTDINAFSRLNIDTSHCSNFHAMLRDMPSVTSLDALANWDVSSGTNFSFMLLGASVTSLDALANWDVSSGTNFSHMLYGMPSVTSLDALANWDVSSGTNFSHMLRDMPSVTSLDALANWDVSSGTNFSHMLLNVSVSTQDYDAILATWGALSVQSGVIIDFGAAQYTTGGAAEAGRNALVAAGWTITDGGGIAPPVTRPVASAPITLEYDTATGSVAYDASQDFTGDAAESYAISGNTNVTLAPVSGVLTIPIGANLSETVTVTATNNGGTSDPGQTYVIEVSTPVAAPVAGSLDDLVYELGQSGGSVTVDLSGGFTITDPVESYEVLGSAAISINSAGLATIDVSAALAATTISVTAENEGGTSAAVTFSLTVNDIGPRNVKYQEFVETYADHVFATVPGGVVNRGDIIIAFSTAGSVWAGGTITGFTRHSDTAATSAGDTGGPVSSPHSGQNVQVYSWRAPADQDDAFTFGFQHSSVNVRNFHYIIVEQSSFEAWHTAWDDQSSSASAQFSDASVVDGAQLEIPAYGKALVLAHTQSGGFDTTTPALATATGGVNYVHVEGNQTVAVFENDASPGPIGPLAMGPARFGRGHGVLVLRSRAVGSAVDAPAQLAGSIAPQLLIENSGVVVIPTAGAFLGDNLTFATSTTQAGMTFNTATGRISVDTGATGLLSGTSFVVTADNEFGDPSDPLTVNISVLESPEYFNANNNGAGLERTSTLSSFDYDGMSFTLDRDYEIGNFVNGGSTSGFIVGQVFAVDPVGVTINSKTPAATGNGVIGAAAAPDRRIHGVMLNPPVFSQYQETQGWDSRPSNSENQQYLTIGYDAADEDLLPLTIPAGSTALFAVSNETTLLGNAKDSINRFVAITCLPSIPAEKPFMPPVHNRRSGTIFGQGYSESSIVQSMPSLPCSRALPEILNVPDGFERFFYAGRGSANLFNLEISDSHGLYGEYEVQKDSAAAAIICSTAAEAQKVPYRNAIIAKGIQQYGQYLEAQDRGIWPFTSNGGQMYGHLMLIAVAGYFLGNSDMMNISTLLGQDLTIPDGPNQISDLDTIKYVTQDMIDITTGTHSSITWSSTGQSESNNLPFTADMLGMPHWMKEDRQGENLITRPGHGLHNYQYATSAIRYGNPLILLACGLKANVAHNAYFDYAWRINEIRKNGNDNDPWAFKGGASALWTPSTYGAPQSTGAGGFEAAIYDENVVALGGGVTFS